MLKWRLRNVYSEFSASGHLAPWLLVPWAVAWSSSCPAPFQKPRNNPDRQNSLQGSTSDQTRQRKFARRPFFVIRPLHIQKSPFEGDKRDLLSISLRQISRRNIRPLGSRQELIISQPFRPTRLPAYPGSPTPTLASGAPGWTSPPASAQTADSTFTQLPSLPSKLEHYSSSSHRFDLRNAS